jgi:hypothetical protein
MARDVIYKWVRTSSDEVLYNVGILGDGSLHNPRGYPEDEVRTAVEAANERRRLRRSEAAKRAAVTRRKRQERKVYIVVERLRNGGKLPGPRGHCYICGKGLDDPESIQRGIGSECWQAVLSALEARHADI